MIDNPELDEKKLNFFREKLLARRAEIFDLRKSLRSDWQTLSEPERELEESAVKENMARNLERFDNRGQLEIDAIDQALVRLENGEYGYCATCGEPISEKRLNALPWARECVECASQRESFLAAAPLDLAEQIEEGELSDEEIVDSIREELERNDQLDTEGLKISFNDGVVSLTGSLANERQHQIVLETINENFGIDEVIDRIDIGEAAFEEITQEDQDADMSAEDKQTAMDGEPIEADPQAAINNEDNEPMVPPDRFIPDREI